MLFAATIVDLRRREIPDVIPVALLGWGVGTVALGYADHGWLSMAAGFVVTGAAGMVLFALGAFGGGDVKLLATLGAAIAWPAALSLLHYSAIAGGILAVGALVSGKKEFPYAPAIALGLLMCLAAGEWQ